MSFGLPTTQVFSPVDWYTVNAGALPTDTAGDFTTGTTFRPLRSVTILGCRIYWNRATTGETLTVKIWNTTDSAAVASANSATTTGAGLYTVLFSSPYVVPSNRINELHYASYRESTGGRYMVTSNANSRAAAAFSSSTYSLPGLLFVDIAAFAAADAKPTSTAVTNRYPCEPILQGGY